MFSVSCILCAHHFLDGDILDYCGKNVPNGEPIRLNYDGMKLGCNEWYPRSLAIPIPVRCPVCHLPISNDYAEHCTCRESDRRSP